MLFDSKDGNFYIKLYTYVQLTIIQLGWTELCDNLLMKVSSYRQIIFQHKITPIIRKKVELKLH